MPVHRLRGHFEAISAEALAGSPVACGFVACPWPIMQSLSLPQHQFVQEVYRIARERTEAVLRPAPRVPEFSMN